jgi:hypothetical protein
MRQGVAVTLSFMLAMFTPSAVPAQDAPSLGGLQVSSDALGAVVLGLKIQLMMRDGTYVEGKVLRASQNEIYMRVKKSVPKEWLSHGQLPGNERSLRTADVAVVHMQKNGLFVIPAALGVIGGYLAGAGAAFAADRVHSQSAYFGIVIVSAAAGATAGVFLGRKAVRQTNTLLVIPVNR